MGFDKYKKTNDGRFIHIPTTLKLPAHIAESLFKTREQMGTPLARQISEIIQKHFKKSEKPDRK